MRWRWSGDSGDVDVIFETRSVIGGDAGRLVRCKYMDPGAAIRSSTASTLMRQGYGGKQGSGANVVHLSRGRAEGGETRPQCISWRQQVS